MLDNFLNELLPVVGTFLGVSIGVLIVYLGRTYILPLTKKLDIENKEHIAEIAISYVEQYAKNEGIKGKEKLGLAKIKLKELAEEQGIKISDENIETFIESTLRGIKDQLGEDWSEIIENNL